MSSFWIRQAVGEDTYKFLVVYYRKLHHYSVIVPMGWRASRQFRKNKSFIHIDLQFGAGYAAILNEILKLLVFEKKTGARVRIRVLSKFYSRSNSDCAIAPYFDVIESEAFTRFPPYSKQTRALIPDLLTAPETRPFYVLSLSIKQAHELFFSRYQFKPSILSDAKSNFELLTGGKKNVLGLHFRGTDKARGDRWSEGNPFDATDFIHHAKSILADRPEIEAIYVATDEQKFLDFARREITTHPVYGEDLKRHASLGLGLHTMPGDPSEKAKEAIMVMLMLSQCRYMLKTTSLLSAWAKVINPDITAFVPQKPRVETGGYVFPDKEVYETAESLPGSPG